MDWLNPDGIASATALESDEPGKVIFDCAVWVDYQDCFVSPEISDATHFLSLSDL